jgi:hypothetical protein
MESEVCGKGSPFRVANDAPRKMPEAAPLETL